MLSYQPQPVVDIPALLAAGHLSTLIRSNFGSLAALQLPLCFFLPQLHHSA
jgi:hypothetical protein